MFINEIMSVLLNAKKLIILKSVKIIALASAKDAALSLPAFQSRLCEHLVFKMQIH